MSSAPYNRVSFAATVLGIIGLWLSVAAPSDAFAHLGHTVQSVERFVRVDFSGRVARVVVSLSLAPREMRALERAWDDDSDGKLEGAEIEAHQAVLVARLNEALRMEVDGHSVRPRWGDVYVSSRRSPGRGPGIVEIVAGLVLDGGVHRFAVLDDGLEENIERTDVRFASHGDAQILACGLGAEPTRRTMRVAYGVTVTGVAEGTFSAVISAPGMRRDIRNAMNALLLMAALVALSVWMAYAPRGTDRPRRSV